MGRPPGSLDRGKIRRVLSAAVELIAESGRDVTMAEIARRAGVSKQTIYNHFAGREHLMEALGALVAFTARCPECPESGARAPEAVLATYASRLLVWVRDGGYAKRLRAFVRGFNGDADTVRRLHRATFGRAVRRLSRFLAQETLRGRLRVEDPDAAAELFLNLVVARPQLEIVGGGEAMTDQTIQASARTCAAVFTRAYAPDPPPLALGASA